MNVCSCHEDGVVNGVDTGRAGCKKHTEGDFFCHISDACPTGNSAPAFDGVGWKPCDSAVDGGGACEDCSAGYEGDGVVCTQCKNSFSDGGAAECTDCPVDRPWAPARATDESECMIFDDPGTFNMFVAEGSSNRVSTFSRSTFDFSPVFQGLPLNAPYGLIFISVIHFVVSSTATDQILKFTYDGTYVGVFASVNEPRGLLLLPDLDPPQVAAAVTVRTAQGTEKKIMFLSAGSGSAIGEVELAMSEALTYVVHDLAAVGGASDQLLVTLAHSTNGGMRRKVWLICVPNTQCSDPTKEIGFFYDIVAGDAGNPPRVAKVSSRSTYFLTCARSVFECQVGYDYDVTLCPPCPVFISGLPVGSWMPGALLVNEKNELLFLSDVENIQIHSFDFDGKLVGTFTPPSAGTSMAFKSGSYSPLAELTPPETTSTASTISLAVSLRDCYGDSLPPDYDISPEMSHLSFTAYGTIQISDDVHIPIPIEGAVSLDAATVDITFAGEWRLELIENFALSSQHVGSSPLTITVDPGPTAFPACTLDYNSSVIAGDTLTITLKTHDEYNNPTDHSSDSFSTEVGGAVKEFSRSTGGTFTMSHRFTQAGAENFKIPAVGQFGLDVFPSVPDAPSSTHNIKAGTELVSETEQLLDLRVFPKDEFNNTVTGAKGYAVSVNGGGNFSLTAPDFSIEARIGDFAGDVTLSFTLDGVDIENSPITITAEPPSTGLSSSEIGAIVVALLTLFLVGSFLSFRHRKNTQLHTLQLQQSHEEEQDLARQRESKLQHINSNLQESLRKKKHSEDELAVMKTALNGLEDKQKDELKEVLISSFEVKVSRLLGKGGFGVVNLATYRGQPTAMKQLLTINDESVKRFR